MKTTIIKHCAILLAASMAAGCNEFLTVNPADSTSKELYYTSASAVRANTATL